MIQIDFYNAYLDFALLSKVSEDKTRLAIASYYSRSLSTIQAISAKFGIGISDVCLKDAEGKEQYFKLDTSFQTSISPIQVGKEKFYHAISFNKGLNEDLIILEDGKEGEQFHSFLMEKFDFPLLKEWGNSFYNRAIKDGMIKGKTSYVIGRNSKTKGIPFQMNVIPLEKIKVKDACLSDVWVRNSIKNLFDCGEICISKNPQNPLKFDNMDSYFRKYGPSLVKNLTDTLKPLTELDGEAHDFTLKNMTLYPQQLAQINGNIRLLDKSKYSILNHGMGTGKTIVAASIAEARFIRKFLRKNPNKTLRDAYISDGIITYRHIVMCPGHLVEKWAAELIKEIPYAKVTILRDFKQLLELRDRGSARYAKEWYIMSKDFAKLSYQSRPTPHKQMDAYIKGKRCTDCGEEYTTPGHTCPKCGSREYTTFNTGAKEWGMICPHCKNLLLPYKMAKKIDCFEDNSSKVLTSNSFKAQTEANSNCYFCEEELWEPNISNIGNNSHKSKWIRVSHYVNKAHKNTKTVWVHKDFQEFYYSMVGERPIKTREEDSATGSRKYSPAEFIKRYLKSYFDIAIFDEVHELKGGSTGQGHAMHALIRSSKKQLCLTGTIAGGYASNLFYLLYRLEPKRMKEKGYEFSSELKFAAKYGKIETVYDYMNDTGDEEYNDSCKGRQRNAPRVKPGISPLIYTDFLLDRATSLDLADMSKFLPPLKETVVSVPYKDGEKELLHKYNSVIGTLKQQSRRKGEFGLLSKMLQFSLSYMDKPYGVAEIKSPANGATVCRPLSFDKYKMISTYDNLLSKEKKLVDLINSELAEGRNCFVYAEYTRSPETCVTHRLKEVIEKFCDLKGKVAILETENPKASERERWIHKQAKNGVKVFITNPRCTATGLDFCFYEDKVLYNYPTIIFYQMGYSMFVVWQASRRHYRLNQKEECRTYYMAWEHTAQMAAISLIAEKQTATSAIQGKFSTEGLAAMANGVDSRMKLAQSLSKMDDFSGNKLQEMFDVLGDSQNEDSTYDGYKPMKLLADLIGCEVEEVKEAVEADDGMLGLFDLFDFFSPTFQGDSSDKEEESKIDEEETCIIEPTPATIKRGRRKSKKCLDNQLSLFA